MKSFTLVCKIAATDAAIDGVAEGRDVDGSLPGECDFAAAFDGEFHEFCDVADVEARAHIEIGVGGGKIGDHSGNLNRGEGLRQSGALDLDSVLFDGELRREIEG